MAKRASAAAESVMDVLGPRLANATIMFHAAVAGRLGVSVTDARCRSILLELGPTTAGELARRLGLTTGAVTGVIDRLEQARLVRRVADPEDRRRVVVELLSERERELTLMFKQMRQRISALTASYGKKDRATIADCLSRTCEILEGETARVRARR